MMKAWLEPCCTTFAIMNGLLTSLHNSCSQSRWMLLLAAPFILLVLGFEWGAVYSVRLWQMTFLMWVGGCSKGRG